MATAFGLGVFEEVEFYCPDCDRGHVYCCKYFVTEAVRDGDLNIFIYTAVCKHCGKSEIMLYKNTLLVDVAVWQSYSGDSSDFGVCFEIGE